MLRPPHAALALLTVFFGISHVLAEGSAKPRGVAVTVGGKPIKEIEIDTDAVSMAKARAQSMNTELTPDQIGQIKKLVATSLIGKQLLELEAQSLHIVATPGQVDSSLRMLKSQFPDEAAFEKTLKESGDNEAKLKAKLAKQIRAEKVMEQHVKGASAPTEAEMREFWEEHQKDFPVNDSLRAAQIVLLADDKLPVEVAEKKKKALEAIREEFVRDSAQPQELLIQRFMATAAQISEGPEAKSGGDLQLFDPNDFNPEFKKQVEKLRVGQISPVFQTPLGFHLVLVFEKFDGKYESYRLLISENLRRQKAMVIAGEMRELLRSLAAKYPVKFLIPGYQDSSENGIY